MFIRLASNLDGPKTKQIGIVDDISKNKILLNS